MAITLSPEARKQALTSLRRFCTEGLELEVTDLQTIGLLDFLLREIGPSIYNGAISDAQAFPRDRVADLEGTCSEPEFAYWPKGSSVRRK